MSGLNCSSINVFKKLEELEGLKTLNVVQWGFGIGSSSTIIDFRSTGLTYAYVRRCISKYLFSSQCDLCIYW